MILIEEDLIGYLSSNLTALDDNISWPAESTLLFD